MINKNVFRAYDIRGNYPNQINEEFAFTLGKSYGTYIKKFNIFKCVVGHDNRLSSPSLEESLIKGILSAGISVIKLGCVTTPMCYYASIFLNVDCFIMVTASHNPREDNGFKFSFNKNGNAKGEEIQEFLNFTLQSKFDVGIGNIDEYSIKKDYFEMIKNSLNFGNRKLKVVIDTANGTTSLFARELYSLFNLDLIFLNEESDGSFPAHHPDPCVESNLEELKNKVLELKADIGLSFDGDGDRIGVVDNKGNTIKTDEYMIIIIRDIINKVDNKTFLFDVKCSKSLEDEIIKLGGIPYMYKTGNSYTKSKVKELDLAFGGEYSGHVFFNDRFPGLDSGMYAGLRILEILSNCDKECSQLLDGVEKYFSTEELKITFDDIKKYQIVEKVKKYAETKNYKINLIDGVKVLFDDSWALVRVSNTGPNITLRFEAKTKERLEEIKEEFINIINN